MSLRKSTKITFQLLHCNTLPRRPCKANTYSSVDLSFFWCPLFVLQQLRYKQTILHLLLLLSPPYPPLFDSFVDFHSEDSSKMPAATAKHLVLQQPSVTVLRQYPAILQNEQPKTRFQKGQQENWKITKIQLSISCYLTHLNVLTVKHENKKP